MNDSNRLIFLLNKLKNNELSYFDEFYNLTKDYIFYNIVKIVNSFDDAEDLLQDTYLYFLKRLKTLRNNHNPIGYLLITARHRSIDFIRKNKRIIKSEEYINLNYYIEYNPLENKLINDLKNVLKKEELELFILHNIDEMTFKEIAKLKKQPLGTILWKYHQIVNKLRKELNYEDYR